MATTNISLIVAIANNSAIGRNNQLLWKIKDDLQLFMKTTSQHVVIHGRKSFESIGKPLPNRTNIIITRDSDYNVPGCFICHSLQEALNLAQRLEQKSEVFILGGAQIYAQALDLVDRMYISHVDAVFENADVYFPDVDLSLWEQISYSSFPQNERNEFSFEFSIYERA